MPRNDQIVRVLTLARELAASRRGISLKTLAERRGWPLRSVYRDLKALERAGFPVDPVEGARYRMIEGWSAPALPGIDRDEILALFTVRALASSWQATRLGRSLDRLWMKLTTSQTGQGTLVPLASEPWFGVRTAMGIDYRAHEKTIATFETAVRERLAVEAIGNAITSNEPTNDSNPTPPPRTARRARARGRPR